MHDRRLFVSLFCCGAEQLPGGMGTRRLPGVEGPAYGEPLIIATANVTPAPLLLPGGQFSMSNLSQDFDVGDEPKTKTCVLSGTSPRDNIHTTQSRAIGCRAVCVFLSSKKMVLTQKVIPARVSGSRRGGVGKSQFVVIGHVDFQGKRDKTRNTRGQGMQCNRHTRGLACAS